MEAPWPSPGRAFHSAPSPHTGTSPPFATKLRIAAKLRHIYRHTHACCCSPARLPLCCWCRGAASRLWFWDVGRRHCAPPYRPLSPSLVLFLCAGMRLDAATAGLIAVERCRCQGRLEATLHALQLWHDSPANTHQYLCRSALAPGLGWHYPRHLVHLCLIL